MRELQPNLLVCSSLDVPCQTQEGAFIVLANTISEQFCASMWTPEESAQIQQIARSIVPDIKTHAIPEGLQVERGPDAVVNYLKENLPAVLDA